MKDLAALSSVPTHNTATEAVAHMDEEITKQMSLLCNLRARRNTFLPVFRLPPETLAIIFIHSARDYHKKKRPSILRIPDWINVSYVCRHWRDVALSCPTLWTYLFTVSLRWTEELLARSRQALLKIRVPFRRRHGLCWSSLMSKLMNHVDRIQELHLHLPTAALAAFLTKRLLRAPHLQHLDLKVLGADPSVGLPSVLFPGCTPALRILELTQCAVPLYRHAPSGLTMLSLCQVSFRSDNDTEALRLVLSRLPNLAVLYFQGPLAGARRLIHTKAFDPQKVNLLSLVRLLVVSPISTVVALLSCVNIPLKTKVRLEFQSESTVSMRDHVPIARALAQRFDVPKDLALSSPTIRSMVIKPALHGRTFIFSAKERDCDPCFQKDPYKSWNCDIPLSIKVAEESCLTGFVGGCIIRCICCSIPLADVQSLHIVQPLSASTFWKEMLGLLPGLRYIKLSKGYMPDMAPALLVENPNEHTPDGPDSTNYAFASALEELELYRMKLSYADDDFECPLTHVLWARSGLKNRVTRIECGESNRYAFSTDGSDTDGSDTDGSDTDWSEDTSSTDSGVE